MNEMLITYQLEPWGWTPTKAHVLDAAFDLYYTNYVEVANRRAIIDTGVHMMIPFGYCGLVLPRSSVTVDGATVCTSVIDAGYTGTIKVIMDLPGPQDIKLQAGYRVAQLLIVAIPAVGLTPGNVVGKKSDRGDGGFGSSGR